MRSSLFHRLLIGCLALAPASLAWAYPVTVQHAQGTTTLQTAPQRVAVFDLATLEALTALDVQQIAGVTRSIRLEQLQQYNDDKYTKIGTLFEPDYEVLETLKPDLILVAGRSRSAYEKLSGLAPTLDLSIPADDFVGGIRHNLALLGQVFDRADQAKKLDNELVAALASLQATGQNQSALVLFTINNNLTIHAPGDRFGMLHEITGMPSVAPPAEPQAGGARPEAGSPEAQAQRERQQARLTAALTANPDWLLVLDRGAATGGEGTAKATLEQDARITATNAWKKGQVYYLDPPSWYTATGGYLGLLQTIGDLQQRLEK